MLCRYRDALGRPGEGFHSARLGGFAAFDVLGTIGLGAAGAALWSGGRPAPAVLLFAIVLAFLVGIAAHWAFCVDTTLNLRLLGPSMRAADPAAPPEFSDKNK